MLQREGVDPVQSCHRPKDDHTEDQDEAGAVTHDRGEGQYNQDPIGHIIGHKDQAEGVATFKLGRIRYAQPFFLPDQQPVGVPLDGCSVERPDSRNNQKTRKVRHDRSGQDHDSKNQGGHAHAQVEQVIPAGGHERILRQRLPSFFRMAILILEKKVQARNLMIYSHLRFPSVVTGIQIDYIVWL